MNRNIKRAALALALTGTVLLSGCNSADTNVRDGIAVVREDTGAEYRCITARQGDITLTETVRIKYFAASQKNYGFGESGVYYDDFLVSVGDEVKSGDILGTLDCASLDAGIADLETTIEELERTLDRNRSLLTLFDERQGDAELSADDSARRREYETAIRDAEDEISIVATELETLRKQREGRVVYADIDGTVTYVREVENGETSVNGRPVFTITNLDSCAFSSTVEHPECLIDGEIYTATISGEKYDVVLTTAEALGIEEEPMNAQSKLTRVYFAPVTPSVNLTADASGSFTITVDQRTDVVYVPTSVLTTVDGVSSVYVLDENGLMSVRNVTVGLTTNRYAEIIEGLEAGDEIVQY